MENNRKMMEALAALRYQLERYHSMKNGFMCQMLNMKIRRLENALELDAKQIKLYFKENLSSLVIRRCVIIANSCFGTAP